MQGLSLKEVNERIDQSGAFMREGGACMIDGCLRTSISGGKLKYAEKDDGLFYPVERADGRLVYVNR